ncbi:helix-turn-helix domain-containing protein [Chamaesiphon minutus]|uniref:Putative transcriptional regulator n=1 Tax=Chamaesiphon minutus (strain ATCC 27169 / PCC 6605) TaxID=1173020 RepID=K9UN63_CHAP6|nr:helix-turn-helix domain-containing protein [Chamaesiphon minutus]AFY96113.1 putative transcriptional regulator [Chamaesiphon minutus PCC 6605]
MQDVRDEVIGANLCLPICNPQSAILNPQFPCLAMPQQLTALDDRINSFGMLLKQWRDRRNFSQLDLALSSEVSQRHISFLESGRAKPSQEMVLQLATVLEIPLRQQNLLLSAAGYAPIHTETDLSAPETIQVRKALDLILDRHDPYPAFAIDRYWNLLLTNQGATRLLGAFIAPERLHGIFYADGKINILRVMFHSQGLRPFIVNWESIASHALQRLHRETLLERDSDSSMTLLNELISDPDIERIWQTERRSTAQHALLLSLHLRRDDLELKFFSTIATLGTPYDITLQELRLECLFPADEATERNWPRITNVR